MGDIPYITTLCLNGTHPCVDFMDVIMGDIPYMTTLCLNGTLPCVDFMDVTMGDIPYMTTLCLNGTLPCVDFKDVIMGDIPKNTRDPVEKVDSVMEHTTAILLIHVRECSKGIYWEGFCGSDWLLSCLVL